MRDGHQDVITGAYDEEATSEEAEKFKEQKYPVSIEAAHIIPDYLNGVTAEQLSDAQEDEFISAMLETVPQGASKVMIPPLCVCMFSDSFDQVFKRSTMWTMLNLFGPQLGKDLSDELAGTLINDVRNVISLSHDLHKGFDELKLWLEAVVCYFLRCSLSASTQSYHTRMVAPPMNTGSVGDQTNVARFISLKTH